jgi:hypothetical protein
MTQRTPVGSVVDGSSSAGNTRIAYTFPSIPAGAFIELSCRFENGGVLVRAIDPLASPNWHVEILHNSDVEVAIATCWDHPGSATPLDIELEFYTAPSTPDAQGYIYGEGQLWSGGDTVSPVLDAGVPKLLVTSSTSPMSHTGMVPPDNGHITSISGNYNGSTYSATSPNVSWGGGPYHFATRVDPVAAGVSVNAVNTGGTGNAANISLFVADAGGGSTSKDLAATAAAQATATAALSGGTGPATVDVSITALDFAGNNASGSDARLMFVGANLPPRTEFSITGSVYWKDQTDYTGLIAFFSDLGSGNWSGGDWEALFCPHNNDGTYDADGDYLAGSPTLRHFEIGGRRPSGASVSRDTISSPASPGPQGSLITTANEWTVFIFRCTQVGADLIYTLQPDIRNHPDFKIVSPSVAADIGSTPATPAFSIGAFKWSGNGSTNPEAPGARVRGMRIIGAHADDADALAEALAGERGTNAWQTSFGASNGWYINDNPTVADIADKSGAGHTPVWDNAQRPADYSGTLTVPAVGVAVDMAAAGTAQASATATLLKGVSLSGAGLAVAGGSASMSHVVPLAASAVAAAVAGGQLAVAVQLSAGALSTAAASAGLALAVPLSADGGAQAGASADLSTNASVDLAADAQASASSSAVLSLTVSLSAAAVSQALASAALAKSVELAANGSAQADGAASLQVGAGTDLAAAAAAQASAGASLWLDVPLGADALAQAVAAGSLSLAVLLGADALAQAGGSAALAGAVQLSAGGQVVATATAGLQVTGPISSYLKGFLARPPERIFTAQPPVRNFTASPPPRI